MGTLLGDIATGSGWGSRKISMLLGRTEWSEPLKGLEAARVRKQGLSNIDSIFAWRASTECVFRGPRSQARTTIGCPNLEYSQVTWQSAVQRAQLWVS